MTHDPIRINLFVVIKIFLVVRYVLTALGDLIQRCEHLNFGMRERSQREKNRKNPLLCDTICP